MIIFYIILIILALSSIRFLGKGKWWNEDYLSIGTANVIKGICIWMVFIRHVLSYMSEIPSLSYWDNIIFIVDNHIKQLLVVPFLFYSGYGVTLSIQKKGKSYVNSIPKKRVLTTLFNFDIAVFFFFLMNLALGFDVDIKQLLLSFTGWESIHNSNWYIFCILICYIISWASYKIVGYNKKMIVCCFAALFMYTAVLYFFKGHWWYDTIYAYGAGAIFAYKKEVFENMMKKHYKFLLVISLLCFFIFYNLPNAYSITFYFTSAFLCMLLLLITAKLKLKNRILEWSGQHLFSLYIYQRIPMVVLSTIYGGLFMNEHPYLYIISSLIITLLIAVMYESVNRYTRSINFPIWQKIG